MKTLLLLAFFFSCVNVTYSQQNPKVKQIDKVAKQIDSMQAKYFINRKKDNAYFKIEVLDIDSVVFFKLKERNWYKITIYSRGNHALEEENYYRNDSLIKLATYYKKKKNPTLYYFDNDKVIYQKGEDYQIVDLLRSNKQLLKHLKNSN